ncbi:metallophosphoesterase family protein [Psychroserpens luteus]|uniref:Metallophosphoesterase family protein n=1 Tax=Psychroserpens luteus TaxID=1434066 RepID=A0ABW5ZUE9_9FLAO|nr:metallophosphoesterase [Psychroserpens luteus]
MNKTRNIYFTSDHHFGHENIIKFTNRPFGSVEEMDQELIKRWNSRVNKHDKVYHLGDFGLCKAERMRDILEQLNGKIFLIRGNHEGAAQANPNRFEWIKDYFELNVNDANAPNGKQKIMLMHYAMRVWRSSFRGTWHLYGHSHGSLKDDPTMNSFDVGVDCHDFYPLTYDEVKDIMSKKIWEPPFKNK